MSFKIHGEVGLDGAMFKRGLHELGGETTAFLKNFALGAVGIASVEQAFSKTIDSAEELVNTSRKLDVTVEQLQVMRQAAEENGVEFNSMSTALERFNAVRENVLNGGKGSAAQLQALHRLGVSDADLKNNTAAQNLMGNISGVAQKSNAADIANDLKQVFGRGGNEIFGVLKTDFGELETKMKSMGMIMDETTAKELKQFRDQMAQIGRILEAQFAPVIISMAKGVFALVFSLGLIGSAIGSAVAYIWEIIRHPINFIKDPKSFGSPLDGASDYVDDMAKKYAQMFGERATDEIKQNVSKPVPDLPKKEKKERDKKQSDIKSDSLLEVGNFLGSGGRAINTIAQQQLTVSLQQLDALNKIEAKLDTAPADSGIDFPDV